MMTAALKRTFFALPILGWIASDIAHRGHENIWYAIGGAVSLVAIATMMFGVVALSMTALALVPVMMITLIAITNG
ncbi:hypothetical protein [Acidimangrovimonas sediminis]|uniref:hypothetical protein n=1 Tax=Acidimangrovimonas sediminis TaxID=2056283 RepID=UPI000C808431|nr:hypothetical protein [Acidimangrovimonas sediminis]